VDQFCRGNAAQKTDAGGSYLIQTGMVREVSGHVLSRSMLLRRLMLIVLVEYSLVIKLVVLSYVGLLSAMPLGC